MFTCGACGHKDVKTCTKKAYNESVVIIKCQNCEENHLIADNLGWFRDEKVNIESLAKETGDVAVRVNNSPKIQKTLEKLKFVGLKGTYTMESDAAAKEKDDGKIGEEKFFLEEKEAKSH